MPDEVRVSIPHRQPPRIKFKKGGAALACLIQNLFHNGFFYLNFLAFYGITTALDDTEEGLANGVTIPIITLFLLATFVTFMSSTLPAVAEVEDDAPENTHTNNTPEALETGTVRPPNNTTQHSWLCGIPKYTYFKALPTINTFLCAFLAGNHVAEHAFGNSQKHDLYTTWAVEIFLSFFAVTKSFVNLNRKFELASNNFAAFFDYCQNSKEKFQVKNWWKFITIVVLPNICSMLSYLIATFFFYRMGCIEQLEEVFCELTAKKICDVRFDTTVTQPDIPFWQILAGIIMTSVSFGTFAFTCIPASLKHYHKAEEPIAPIEHKNAWRFVYAVNCIDAISQSLIFFVGTAANIAFLFDTDMKDWRTIVPAGLIGGPAAYSYLDFQNTYAEQKFNDTYRRLENLCRQLNLNFKKLIELLKKALLCRNSAHTLAVLEEVAAEKDSLISSLSINYDSIDSTNNNLPHSATRKMCRIM